MKTCYLLIAASLLFFLASCDPDDTSVPQPGQHVSSVNARVNSTTFLSQEAVTQSLSGGLDIYGGRQTGGKSSSILLSIKHFVGLTTYNIDTATSATYTENGVPFKATTGSITVTTSNAAHVAGTFSFEAIDSNATTPKSVTGGAFDIYQ